MQELAWCKPLLNADFAVAGNHGSFARERFTGLAAGANDYMAKPFDPVELEARVRVGERMVTLQARLNARVAELELALAHVERLQGLLPICSYCKKVRNEANYWEQVDSYLAAHSDLDFTHSICPTCAVTLMEQLDESTA